MYSRIFRPPSGSYFLFGPRGTGKTTLLKHLYPDAVVFNLLLERSFQKYLVNPDLFYAEVQALPKGTWVVVDEVQRLPGLLNYVHQLIEEKKWKFVLTGSSARKLRRSGVNLLAGRAAHRLLFPFLPEELGKSFDLSQSLRFGMLPIVLDSEDPAETLEAYVETYLRQEIKEEGLVKNLSGFSRFLQVAAMLHGQSLNISNVAREAEVSRMTVNGFFEILEDTLIGYRLPAFSAKLRVREAKHPKFYFFDSGIVRVLKQKSGEVETAEAGPLLEGFVLHLLRSYQAYNKTFSKISYWQPTESGRSEVDFVVEQGKELCAIEVKATKKVRPEDLKGLEAIKDLNGLKRRILVYRGADRLKLNRSIEVLPVSLFCEELSKGRLFKAT